MHSLARARCLLASDHGRRDGWYVELNGNRIGELSDVRWEAMFCDSYAVTAARAHPFLTTLSGTIASSGFRMLDKAAPQAVEADDRASS